MNDRRLKTWAFEAAYRQGVGRRAIAVARHSSLDLTMNIHTDPVLLDVGPAIDGLPTLDATERPIKATNRA